jgi:squalene-hopene/tetraprenyl-beta-curcumene cyclase
MRDRVTEQTRRAIIDQAVRTQSEDGGWTLASLGPWPDHSDAPATRGTDAYATAITAFVLQQIGDSRALPALNRALDWLRSHQDPATGTWTSSSMNKHYEAGSMMEQFMRDAATGYATAALAEADRTSRP